MKDAKSYKTEKVDRAATPVYGLTRALQLRERLSRQWVVQAAGCPGSGLSRQRTIVLWAPGCGGHGLADIVLLFRLAATAVTSYCTTKRFHFAFNFPLSGIPTTHWKEHMVLQLH